MGERKREGWNAEQKRRWVVDMYAALSTTHRVTRIHAAPIVSHLEKKKREVGAVLARDECTNCSTTVKMIFIVDRLNRW